jgi:Bacterial alpha-L-rhamnosidase 6 hairpin glycosidase domain
MKDRCRDGARATSFKEQPMRKRFVIFIFAVVVLALGVARTQTNTLQYESAFMRVELAPDRPAFVALAVDSLGKNKLSVSALRPPARPEGMYQLSHAGSKYEYRPSGTPTRTPAQWTFEFSDRQIRLHSHFAGGNPPPPFVLSFNSYLNHVTLLGHINNDGSVRLPALLHLPDLGTFRITAIPSEGLTLGYDALRHSESPSPNSPPSAREGDYVKVTFSPASASRPDIDYTLEVVAIYPGPPELARDPRFDGFRRNWLSIFQLNPQLRALANNSSSDACAFTLFEYSSIAERTPPLAAGLTAQDLIRQTLDRYISGMKGYGIAGYRDDPKTPYDFLDTYPSLLIAAWDYVRGSQDEVWLNKNYTGLKGWATRMLAMDPQGSGLFEYPASGNSGSWPEELKLRPANWWDDIGFGHEDAYSNALAYHALLGMAEMARRAGRPEDAQLYASRARKLRSVYFETFYNPATGVLAGWRSADGKLHDYYFMFVNSVAIVYGLVPPDKANQIMDRLLAKMKEVDYTNFEYGLPGNLVPIRREDYAHHILSSGGGEKEDGSDGFQIYQNGGATASSAYFTLQALYQLGRPKEADAILFPLLRGFEEGEFQGFGPNGKSLDWKAWDGTPHGYEGLLVDGYQALLAVLSR